MPRFLFMLCLSNVIINQCPSNHHNQPVVTLSFISCFTWIYILVCFVRKRGSWVLSQICDIIFIIIILIGTKPIPILLPRTTMLLWPQRHYGDVIMSAMASQITGVSVVCSPCGLADEPAETPLAPAKLFAEPFVQAQIKENIKAPHHWHLWGESTGNQGASNTENVSIWWRHHVSV